MSFAAWLFLYVGGLVELAIRYRLSLGHGLAAYAVLIPLAAVALLLPLRRTPELTRNLTITGIALMIACVIPFARILSLDFWDTQRMDLAWLSAGIGVGALLTVREDRALNEWRITEWLVVSGGWTLALWNPIGPWLALVPAASLGLFQPTTPQDKSSSNTTGVSPAWALFWIGMAISKSWWDSDTWGAMGTALWALGVAITYAPRIRDVRLPWPLLWLALCPLLYPWLPIWIWAPLLGLLSGWLLQQTAKPLHWAATYAFLAGCVLSYAMHSNLQLFGWLVWGSH